MIQEKGNGNGRTDWKSRAMALLPSNWLIIWALQAKRRKSRLENQRQ